MPKRTYLSMLLCCLFVLQLAVGVARSADASTGRMFQNAAGRVSGRTADERRWTTDDRRGRGTGFIGRVLAAWKEVMNQQNQLDQPESQKRNSGCSSVAVSWPRLRHLRR